MSEFLFLGIDGGGTKCRARLRDAEGKLLGEGSGGPSNIRLDPDLVWTSILTACREALSQAGLPEDDLGRVRAGMGAAGAGQRSAVARLLSRQHPFASFVIDTDAHRVQELDFMRYGVGQARRGWCEAKDVANTCRPGALRKLLEK